jgi:PadR family transcriptional regulator, regulatory protein PadR
MLILCKTRLLQSVKVGEIMIDWLNLMGRKKDPDDSLGDRLPSLSPTEAMILQMLIDGGEFYGLQMVETSGGRLKRGTIYVTLQRMEEKGFVESRQEPRPEGQIGIPRRMYKASGLGQRVYSAWEMAAMRFVEGNV